MTLMLRLLACALLLSTALASLACAQEVADTTALPATPYFRIATPYGDMTVRLYDETPLHRDNFKRLAAAGAYDSTTFHRVIAGFMVQGGDPNSRDDDPANDGMGDVGHTIPAEIVPGLSHRRGALAAARKADVVNRDRRSSGSQFYLVHEEAVHLDGAYTIFGQLVEGFDVLDRVARAATPRALGEPAPPVLLDRPLTDIPMTVRPLPDYVEPAMPVVEPGGGAAPFELGPSPAGAGWAPADSARASERTP